MMIAGLLAVLLAPLAPMQAGLEYYEAHKFETEEAYMFTVVHGIVHATEHHEPVWTNKFWRTDLTLDEFDSPLGDQLIVNYRGAHRVAVHVPEPAFGPWFKTGAWLNTSTQLPFALTFGGGTHGEHIDAQFIVTVPQYAFPDIRSYIVIGAGIHFGSQGDILDIIRRFAIAGGAVAVPPTESEAKAVCAVTSGANGQAMVNVSVVGLYPPDLVSAELRLGLPGEEGLAVMDLGVEGWLPMEHGMYRQLVLSDLPRSLREPLRQGLLSVNLGTKAYPSGEIRGWLSEWKPTLPRIGQ